MKRFLSFIRKIRSSSKPALRHLLELVQHDVRLTTGFNLRYIMLLTGMNKVEELESGNIDHEYHQVENDEKWRINVIEELIDVRLGELSIPGIELKEIEEILENICTN